MHVLDCHLLGLKLDIARSIHIREPVGHAGLRAHAVCGALEPRLRQNATTTAESVRCALGLEAQNTTPCSCSKYLGAEKLGAVLKGFIPRRLTMEFCGDRIF